MKCIAAGHPSHPAAHVLIEEGCLYRVVVCPKSHSMPRWVIERL
jgi:hypothetical protein